MARRAALINKKVKAPRVTRSESYIINKKYMGDEPVFKAPLSELEYRKAFNWYNTMATVDDAREYMESFLKESDMHLEAKRFKSVPDSRVPLTACWIARMLTLGYELPETAIPFFMKKLEESLTFSKIEKENDDFQSKVTVQDRVRDRASDIIGEIEAMIDSGEQFSLYDWLKKNEIPATYATSIMAHYVPWLGELLEVAEGQDEQLNEAYAKYPKNWVISRINFINALVEESERYGTNTKKVRKPRKPRPVSMEKKLKNLKFQKEDQNLKIVSVSPEKVIGAQEIWAFNTKYKTLTVIRALDRGGLDIKGTSVIKYDEKISCTKRVGRKTETYLEKVLNGGKVVLRKLMDEIKYDAPLAHRINENTIILKVV